MKEGRCGVVVFSSYHLTSDTRHEYYYIIWFHETALNSNRETEELVLKLILEIHNKASRRGISPVVSSLLMVVVVVAASSIAVLWSSGSLQQLQIFFGNQSNAVQEAIAIEDVYFNVANNTLRPYVRDVGPILVTLKAVIVTWSGGTILVNISPSLSLGSGQLTTVSSFSPVFAFPAPCKLAAGTCGGVTFTVKIITALGNSDIFQLFVP